jgi:hypothetical protein
VRPRGERNERNETRHTQAPLLALSACGQGQEGGWDFSAPGRRDDPALLVSPAVVMAAAPRAHLLTDGADADLGFSAALRRPECGLLRPRAPIRSVLPQERLNRRYAFTVALRPLASPCVSRGVPKAIAVRFIPRLSGCKVAERTDFRILIWSLTLDQYLPSPRPSGGSLVIIGPGIGCQGQWLFGGWPDAVASQMHGRLSFTPLLADVGISPALDEIRRQC